MSKFIEENRSEGKTLLYGNIQVETNVTALFAIAQTIEKSKNSFYKFCRIKVEWQRTFPRNHFALRGQDNFKEAKVQDMLHLILLFYYELI